MRFAVLPFAGASLLCACLLCACSGAPTRREVVPQAAGVQRVAPNVPDYAARPYEPFTAAAAVAIAMREWRVFGQPVDDDPPDTRPPPPPDQKPERFEGLWQRVGDYWYEGLNLSQSPQVDWTGKHDGWGVVFPAEDDGEYAWSAAFISYVMRVAGAGARFPYSPSHDTYIDAALRMATGVDTGWVVTALPINAYAPVPGDLICESRTNPPVRFEDLPRSFPGHCDIVVAQSPGQISVLGGNVDDAVTMKHVPVAPDGRLGMASDQPIDSRYPWFVVLHVAYDTPVAEAAPPAATPADAPAAPAMPLPGGATPAALNP
jgi:hypothetical protein